MSSQLKKILLISCIALVALGATFFVLEKLRITNVIQTPPSREEIQSAEADAAKKKQFIEAKEAQEANIPTTPTTPPTDNISITTKRESNDTITVSTKLTGYAAGECKLSIVNGDKTFSATARVIYQPDFSTCAGFSIPISELGSGTWDVTLGVTSNGTTVSKTASTEVD